MINIQEARKIMIYYGFSSASVEPILCEYGGQIGLFATFKTNYGHLSRLFLFSTEKELKEFLKLYLWYRKNIDDKKTIVEFDNYEKINPKIKFLHAGKEITSNNTLKKQTEEVEVLIDTTYEDNKKLLEIVFEEITRAYLTIKNTEEELKKVIEDYKNKVQEYNNLLVSKIQSSSITINRFSKDELDKQIINIRNNLSEGNYLKTFDATLELLENTMLSSDYLDNIYLIDYYREEIANMNKQMESYRATNGYSDKLSKNKRSLSFDEYIKKNPKLPNMVDKNTLVINKQTEIENKLIQWKNNGIEDLKIIYGITKKTNNKNLKTEANKDDLVNYFMSLSINERNQILIITSPMKEIINLVYNMDHKDKLFTILNENYYLDKFKDLYSIMSNDDNFAASRKFFKSIKIDTLEEFVESIVDFTKNIKIKPFDLLNNTKIKFKIGVLLKKGYINASISDNYPVNNRGANNYYICNLKHNLDIYYAPYIVQLDSEGNLYIDENNDIILFDINNLKILETKEVKVNDYILKTTKENKKIKYKFSLLNEKIYITSNLENGE